MPPPAPRPIDRSELPLAGLVHLAVLYTVWSSTYLAIRIAVRDGGGFPPFWMAGSRALVAALAVLAWSAFRGQRLRLTRPELAVLAVSGPMLWVGGNGLVTWAEQQAESGFAALLVGSMPIWVALIEAVIDRRMPSRLLSASLLVGLAGVALLTSPSLRGAEAPSTIALIAAPIIWAGGSVLQQRRKVDVAPFVSSGYQMLFGAACFAVLVVALKEPVPAPAPDAWAAWVYLVVFGSILAFTSFVQALRLLPSSIVMTYAYVNPVFAALLGWWVLDEAITWRAVAGGALVLAGVAGVFRERLTAAARDGNRS
jgi:drug/metabolite transporter (DMT)-like permease